MYMHWQEIFPVIAQEDNINANLHIFKYACMIAIQGCLVIFPSVEMFSLFCFFNVPEVFSASFLLFNMQKRCRCKA